MSDHEELSRMEIDEISAVIDEARNQVSTQSLHLDARALLRNQLSLFPTTGNTYDAARWAWDLACLICPTPPSGASVWDQLTETT
jgi:hypothetical protein